MRSFEEILDEVTSHPLEGWDFSRFEGRNTIEPVPWDYRARVESLAAGTRAMVDLGTGGGEFLLELGIRPPVTVATEGWMPNVPIAARNLHPVGAHVVAYEGASDNATQRFMDVDGPLPFREGAFDLVIDRHEAFRATEVARVLTSGGTFLTQQVGSRNEIELNDALGDDVPPSLSPSLEEYVEQLRRAGLEVVDAQEAFALKRYFDIGPIVMLLTAIPWQYEGFDLQTHRPALRAIHDHIAERGAFETHHHRLLLQATKP